MSLLVIEFVCFIIIYYYVSCVKYGVEFCDMIFDWSFWNFEY